MANNGSPGPDGALNQRLDHVHPPSSSCRLTTQDSQLLSIRRASVSSAGAVLSPRGVLSRHVRSHEYCHAAAAKDRHPPSPIQSRTAITQQRKRTAPRVIRYAKEVSELGERMRMMMMMTTMLIMMMMTTTRRTRGG